MILSVVGVRHVDKQNFFIVTISWLGVLQQIWIATKIFLGEGVANEQT